MLCGVAAIVAVGVGAQAEAATYVLDQSANLVFDRGPGNAELDFYYQLISGSGLFYAQMETNIGSGYLVTSGFNGNATSDLQFFDLGVAGYNGGRVTLFKTDPGSVLITYTGTYLPRLDTPTVPEPATWALMILGFGAIGASLRARSRKVRFA